VESTVKERLDRIKKSGQVNTFVPASLMLITKITQQIYQVDIRVDFWRTTWNVSKDEEAKTKLTVYNKDDCNALKLLNNFISQDEPIVNKLAARCSDSDNVACRIGTGKAQKGLALFTPSPTPQSSSTKDEGKNSISVLLNPFPTKRNVSSSTSRHLGRLK
jgi:hypothetical protein